MTCEWPSNAMFASCQARAQHGAVQAGDKPKEAHKRTLELEGSAEALGPAQKKRIVEGGAPSAAVAASTQPGPAHGQQNGLAGPHAGSAAAAQPNRREHSASAAASSSPAQPQALSAGTAEIHPNEAGGAAGLGSADVKAEDQQAGPAGPHGMPAKQEAISAPAKQGAQTSREATPELCIDRIDGKTGQVSHCGAPRCDHRILSFVKLSAMLDLRWTILTPRMIIACNNMHVGISGQQITAARAGSAVCSMCIRKHHKIEGALDYICGVWPRRMALQRSRNPKQSRRTAEQPLQKLR